MSAFAFDAAARRRGHRRRAPESRKHTGEPHQVHHARAVPGFQRMLRVLRTLEPQLLRFIWMAILVGTRLAERPTRTAGP
jgi:hypothetical protein